MEPAKLNFFAIGNTVFMNDRDGYETAIYFCSSFEEAKARADGFRQRAKGQEDFTSVSLELKND